MLHVTNGDSAAGKLAAAGLGGDVLAWRDIPEEGPVPWTATGAELNQRRAEFLAACGWATAEHALAEMTVRDQRLAAAPEVALWFEHDLHDQMQLLQVLALLSERPHRVIHVVPVEVLAADPTFGGLGAVTAADLAALYPSRSKVTDELAAGAAAAWDALRDADPAALSGLAEAEAPGLPHLRDALVRLLEEYPSTSDGLSRTEEALLMAVAAGAVVARGAYAAYCELDPRHTLGDWIVWRRLLDLAHGPHPLLNLAMPDGRRPTPSDTATAGFLECSLELTAAGQAVLRGDEDRAAIVPLDRWIGGVHLTSPAPAWRWDRDTRRLHAG